MPIHDNSKPFISPRIPLADLLRNGIDPPPMLAGGVLPKTGFVMLTGAPGVGKTWVAVDAAMSLALGREVFGVLVQKAVKVAYLAIGDDAPNVLMDRFQKVARGKSTDSSSPNGIDRSILAGTDEMIHLHATESIFQLESKAHWAQIRALFDACDVVVFDPMAQLFAMTGGENQADCVLPLLEELRLMARETDSLLIGVHHNNKAASGSDSDIGLAMRGSSAIGGATRGVIRVDTYDGPIPGSIKQRIRVSTRYDEPLKPFVQGWLFDDDRGSVRVNVLREPHPVALSGTRRKGLHGAMLTAAGAATFSIDDLANMAEGLGVRISDGRKFKKALRRWLEGLEKEGRVQRHRGGKVQRWEAIRDQ